MFLSGAAKLLSRSCGQLGVTDILAALGCSRDVRTQQTRHVSLAKFNGMYLAAAAAMPSSCGLSTGALGCGEGRMCDGITACAQVAAAVFALRGTRLSKAGTVQADIQLMKDRDAELFYAQRALKHCRKHIRRLQQQQPAVQWAFFTTGAAAAADARVTRTPWSQTVSPAALWLGRSCCTHAAWPLRAPIITCCRVRTTHACALQRQTQHA